jgi:hypothetical protein
MIDSGHEAMSGKTQQRRHAKLTSGARETGIGLETEAEDTFFHRVRAEASF